MFKARCEAAKRIGRPFRSANGAVLRGRRKEPIREGEAPGSVPICAGSHGQAAGRRVRGEAGLRPGASQRSAIRS